MTTSPIKAFLNSEDPLSDDCFHTLLVKNEENEFVDYKETFSHEKDKSWLELTKDVSAFANTQGGYLVFGIRDGTFEHIGIEPAVASALFDASSLMQKINRHIEPDITNLRVRQIIVGGKTFAAIYVPASKITTHLFKRDGEFKYQKGSPGFLFRAHTFYVRRTGANHIADSRDLEDLIHRRLRHYKDTLLKDFARVIEAPPQAKVLIVTEGQKKDGAQPIYIGDGPDALKVQGLTLAVPPKTLQETIAAWTVFCEGNCNALPPSSDLWKWYLNRETLALSEDQRLAVAYFCLSLDVPWFFWIKECNSQSIKRMINKAIRSGGSNDMMSDVLSLSAFLGKSTHTKVVRGLGERVARLGKTAIRYPSAGLRSIFSPQRLEAMRGSGRDRMSDAAFRELALTRLNGIAAEVDKRGIQQPELMDRTLAKALDCFLYSREDKYRT